MLFIRSPIFGLVPWRFWIQGNWNLELWLIPFALMFFAPLARGFRERRVLWGIVTIATVVLFALATNLAVSTHQYINLNDVRSIDTPDLNDANSVDLNDINTLINTDSEHWVLTLQAVLMRFAAFALLLPLVDWQRAILDAIAFRRMKKWYLLKFALFFSLLAISAIAISTSFAIYGNPKTGIQINVLSSNVFVSFFIMFGFFGVVWFAVSIIIFSAFLFLFSHFLIWNIIKRPPYAMARYNLFARHGTVGALGVLFIGFAFPHHWILDILKELLEALTK